MTPERFVIELYRSDDDAAGTIRREHDGVVHHFDSWLALLRLIEVPPADTRGRTPCDTD